MGGHEILFLDSPVGGFFNDDAFGIQLNWEAEPFGVRLSTFKAGEGSRSDADDNDFYIARVGVRVSRDLSGQRGGPARRHAVLRGADGGGTLHLGGPRRHLLAGRHRRCQLGVVRLDGTAVYGQRRMFCPPCASGAATERGWGALLVARAPVDQWSFWGQGWITTGDERRGTGAFATLPVLEGDSDKLPVPESGASWNSGRLMAEWLFGASSLGAPAGPAGGFSPPTTPIRAARTAPGPRRHMRSRRPCPSARASPTWERAADADSSATGSWRRTPASTTSTTRT